MIICVYICVSHSHDVYTCTPIYIFVDSLEDVFLKCLCCWWPPSHGHGWPWDKKQQQHKYKYEQKYETNPFLQMLLRPKNLANLLMSLLTLCRAVGLSGGLQIHIFVLYLNDIIYIIMWAIRYWGQQKMHLYKFIFTNIHTNYWSWSTFNRRATTKTQT